MAQTITNPEPDSNPQAATDCTDAPVLSYFGFERLDCYRVALDFQTIAVGICANRSVGANLRDQLDRASVSIVLSIAEASGRRTLCEQSHFFAIARGSATECAAVLDVLIARGFLADAAARHGRGLLVRVVQMLSRLIGRHRAS